MIRRKKLRRLNEAEMFKQIDYTMVVVSDMQRSVEFYRDKLGIPLKFQTPDWTEFRPEPPPSRCMVEASFLQLLPPVIQQTGRQALNRI